MLACPASAVEYDCERFKSVWNAPSLASAGGAPKLLYVFLPGTGTTAAKCRDGLLESVAKLRDLSVIGLSYGSSPWCVCIRKLIDLCMLHAPYGSYSHVAFTS